MTIKKTLVSLLSALSFCTPSQAQDNWANARLGFSTQNQNLSAHSEGHFQIPSFGYLYGVLYLDRKQLQDKEFLDYLEKLRLHYDLGNISGRLRGFGLASEFNKGSESKYKSGTIHKDKAQILRLGLEYEISPSESAHFLIKLYPLVLGSGEEGEKVQASAFVSQDISRRLNASVLFNYGFKPRRNNNKQGQDTYYLEPEAIIKLYKGLGLFVQGRVAETMSEKINRALVVGARFDVK